MTNLFSGSASDITLLRLASLFPLILDQRQSQSACVIHFCHLSNFDQTRVCRMG